MPKQYGTPGPRALFPDVCTSPTLAACDPLGQLLFDRLLVLADDQGRVQLQPEWVKANAMPFVSDATTRSIRRWIEQFQDHELLIVYAANSVPLGQFVTWWQRQAGQRRAYPSRWPAPPGWDQDRVYGLPRDQRPGTLNGPRREPEVPAERAQDAGEVRAQRGHDAGAVPPSRAGFRAGALANAESHPNPSRKREGRRNGRSSGRSYDDLVRSDADDESTGADLSFEVAR